MQPGIEPWSIITFVTSVVGEVISFFTVFHQLRRVAVARLLAFSVACPVAGGVLWNYLNKINNWPFLTFAPSVK